MRYNRAEYMCQAADLPPICYYVRVDFIKGREMSITKKEFKDFFLIILVVVILILAFATKPGNLCMWCLTLLKRFLYYAYTFLKWDTRANTLSELSVEILDCASQIQVAVAYPHTAAQISVEMEILIHAI